MALIKCGECGKEISTEAKACPGCGAPTKSPVMSSTVPPIRTFFKGLGIILGLLTFLSILGGIFAASSKPKQASERKEVDYSLPIFTTRDTPICPTSILFEKREDKGLRAATDAAVSIFGRSEAIGKVGCEEWRAGIPLFIKYPDKERIWQEVTTTKEGTQTFLAIGSWLTNNPKGEVEYVYSNVPATTPQPQSLGVTRPNSAQLVAPSATSNPIPATVGERDQILQAVTNQPESNAKQPTTSVPLHFNERESYGTVRTEMIKGGWTPFHATDADTCSENDNRCKGRTEMESCSGTGLGYCKFLWKKNENIIAICTVAGTDDAEFDSVCSYP